MYAVIRTGSKQYKVKKGSIILVELLSSTSDNSIEFNEVLFVNDGSKEIFGNPVIEGAVVKGEILGTVPGKKITSVKYKTKCTQYHKFGHRQKYHRVEIQSIAK